jgi:hypothetical protein
MLAAALIGMMLAGSGPDAAAQQPGGAEPARPAGESPGGQVFPNPAALGPGIPSADILEVMVKSALMTFNDANETGNYTVFNARLHPEFRQQVPAERLAEVFTPFRANKISVAAALFHKPVYTDGPSLDARGLLVVKGHMETRPWRTQFDLAWRRERDAWWLWKINVHVRPPAP